MGGGSDLKRLSGNQNLLLGMVSGCGSKLINYPFLQSFLNNSLTVGIASGVEVGIPEGKAVQKCADLVELEKCCKKYIFLTKIKLNTGLHRTPSCTPWGYRQLS